MKPYLKSVLGQVQGVSVRSTCFVQGAYFIHISPLPVFQASWFFNLFLEHVLLFKKTTQWLGMKKESYNNSKAGINSTY